MTEERPRWKDLTLSLAVSLGYGYVVILPVLALLGSGLSSISPILGSVVGGAAAIGALAGWIVVTRRAYLHARAGHRAGLSTAWAVFVLGVMIAWGLALNGILDASCVEGRCDPLDDMHRPLAVPEVFGLLALHLAVTAAFTVSRRRPEALHPWAEASVHAVMLAGVVAHAVIAVQFVDMMAQGVIYLGIGAPAIAPLLTVGLLLSELDARLRRRGAEALRLTAQPVAHDDAVYRAAQLTPDEAPVRGPVHAPTLARAAALTPVVLGLHAVAHALWLHETSGAFRVFTRTCGHVLSTLPVQHVTRDCHYLCTVAAQGHPWLVRPERIGRRGGVDIVVNRQLALANAFEDLLHDRWPRFGALCRRVYDRVGIPIAGALRRRWLADLVYVAMKPAEWCFYLALLLLDRGDPEARIARMYRR